MIEQTKKINSISTETVENASRFLSKILRHEPEEWNISLNDRGWASVKSVRIAFNQNQNFEKRGCRLLNAVLELDEKNRFQMFPEKEEPGDIVGEYAFIRATRGHTNEDVNLEEVNPDEEDLNWYLVKYNGNRQSEYVEATSIENVKRVIERESGVNVNWEEAEFEKLNEEIEWGENVNDDISGQEAPHVIYHQSGDKYFKVEQRANQTGDKGRYVSRQTKRVRDRLPPEN